MLRSTAITSRSINLTWVEPHDNNAPIQSYLVEYTEPQFVMGERNRQINTTVEVVFITGLYPGITYTFTVTAINDIGRSLASEPLIERTLDEGKFDG